MTEEATHHERRTVSARVRTHRHQQREGDKSNKRIGGSGAVSAVAVFAVVLCCVVDVLNEYFSCIRASLAASSYNMSCTKRNYLYFSCIG